MSFGLSEVSSGDAATTLKCFTETIDDLCDAVGSKDKDADFANMITSIKTTMSDLGPINPVFNCKLKVLREELLPKVTENWNDLSSVQKQQMGDMANYSMSLQIL